MSEPWFAPATGMVIGEYTLDLLLGRGGYGQVWRARAASGRMVAIKLLTEVNNFRDEAADRHRTVEVLASLAAGSSENLVGVLGHGDEPVPYIVMEYVDGTDLQSELRRRREAGDPLRAAATIHIGTGIARGLRALHEAAIIHRDIKPANVLMDRLGTAKLADFGISKIVGYGPHTETGHQALSAYYAAPEVWRNRANEKSDIYALGALLFECLAGEPPFVGALLELAELHRDAEPDWALLPQGLPAALAGVIRRCLGKDPAARPTAADVLHELLEAESVLGATPAPRAQLSTRAPARLGPWQVESPRVGQPWTFHCTDGTGEAAIVELHFTDDLDLGERLALAVAANDELVEQGAERLLGSSRLILGTGEGWPDAPPGRFIFWAAREAAAGAAPGAVLDADGLRAVAGAVTVLSAAANRRGLALELSPETMSVDALGRLRVSRPGLPSRNTTHPYPRSTGSLMELLGTLPMSAEARRELSRWRGPEATDGSAHEAVIGDPAPRSSWAVPRQPPWTARRPADGLPRRATRRLLIAAGLAGGLLAGAAAAAVIVLGGGSGDTPGGAATVATATSARQDATAGAPASLTPVASPSAGTSTPSSTSTTAATTGATPATTLQPQAPPNALAPTSTPTSVPTPTRTPTPTPTSTPTITPTPIPGSARSYHVVWPDWAPGNGEYLRTFQVLNGKPVYRNANGVYLFFFAPVNFTRSGGIWVLQEPPPSTEWKAAAFGDAEWPDQAVWEPAGYSVTRGQ